MGAISYSSRDLILQAVSDDDPKRTFNKLAWPLLTFMGRAAYLRTSPGLPHLFAN